MKTKNIQGELKMSSLNEMKEIFDEIKELCKEDMENYGERSTYFKEPATEEEILQWEKTTNIKMPKSYKMWLKLTRRCQIDSTLAQFYFPDTEQPRYVPEGYVMIGNIIGDGEIVCFSKNKGKFITYFEGNIDEEYEDFMGLLGEVKRLLIGAVPKISFTEEKIKMMLAKSEEFRK